MSRVFNRFSRLVLVAALAGVTVPQLAAAGDHGGKNFSKAMKTGSGSQFRNLNLGSSSSGKFQKINMPSVSRNVLKTPKVSNFKPLNSNLNSQDWNKPLIKTVPTTNVGNQVILPGKIKTLPGRLIDRDPLTNGGINPFPGGKPILDQNPPFTPFPGGKPPKLNDPFVPFPGGKPPIFDPDIPFPGGKPPIDPGQGNGGGGNGGGNGNGNGNGNGGNHCHNKCPWPIFWPIYGGGYWNNYNNGYCTTPTVIVNEAPPVVVNDVTPVAATAPTGTNGVDLVLEDIQYVEPATMLVGPAYRVKFRNQGLAAAGGFRVAIVASVNGTADAKSPMALVDVADLGSGQSSEVTVRLPRTAMQLTTADGQTTAFTHLLVAADFDNLISEADKANNVAIVARTQLEVAVK